MKKYFLSKHHPSCMVHWWVLVHSTWKLEPLETTGLMETFVINSSFMTWYIVRAVTISTRIYRVLEYLHVS
jgi:hypothetical protein